MGRKRAAAQRKLERKAYIRGLRDDAAVRWVERRMTRRARARRKRRHKESQED